MQETDSTNRYLHDLDLSPDDGMTVVVADFQTAGKGQGSNLWESEPGQNLLFSIAITPRHVPVNRQFILSEAGALAVGDALAVYTDDISLKWPNDVYWRDRKISGTLIETSVSTEGLKKCIFGIGINVNQLTFHSDAPNPVSLAQIIGREIPLEEVLDSTLRALDYYLALIDRGEGDAVSALYHTRLYRRDGLFIYEDKEGVFRAAIDHVEDDGHLILCDEQGCLRSYAFKEVQFIIHNSQLTIDNYSQDNQLRSHNS